MPLPMRELVAVAAQRGGRGQRRRATSPLANFYFGGFGNNYVDSRAVKRYRDYDRFPGFGIDEHRGPELRAHSWSNGTCRRWFSSRSARPAST